MFSEWFHRYRNLGDREAGEKMVWYGYLIPQLMKEISRFIKLDVVNVPIPDWNKPQPDPSPERFGNLHDPTPTPMIDQVIGERMLGRMVMGDPSPQPSLQSPRLRLEAARALRANLKNLVADLNEEIVMMQKTTGKLTKVK